MPDHPTIYDITPPITPSTNVWPGDTPPTREVLLDTARGDNITLSTLRSTVHLGAHADGPIHYAPPPAPGVGEMPLHHYLGPCHILDAPVPRSHRVTPSDIRGGLDTIKHPRVLVRTGTFPDLTAWNNDFAALSVELIESLAALRLPGGGGVITIGIDTPSVDLIDSKDLPAPKAILRHDIAILEGLDLSQVPTPPLPHASYELIALPLKLMAFDASPVRAILRPMP
jgi:arylformamidase